VDANAGHWTVNFASNAAKIGGAGLTFAEALAHSLPGTMPSAVQPSAQASPDRLFARTTRTAVLAGLAVLVAAFAVLERAQERQAGAAALAMVAAEETAAARGVIVALDRLAALPEGGADRTAITRLAWEVDRLATLEDRRLELTPGLEPSEGSIGAIAAKARLGRIGPGMPAQAVLDRFESGILPQLDLIAERSRTAAEEARLRGRWTLAGALATQFLAGALVLAGVVQPARRRIDAWVARMTEEARENRHRLLHDPLTGMPNLTYFHAFLGRLGVARDRVARQTAVLRIDLDRFKVLREALGQTTSDEVLRITARRLQKAARAGDFAAHLGGDDFVLVAVGLVDSNDAATIAARMQQAVCKPFSLRGGARRITCSVGVTLLSDDRPESDRALANAEIALAAAQGAGPGNIRYFREDLRLEAERREALYTGLTRALEAGDIVAFFQPQIDLATGAFRGFEALARWQHEDGVLAPDSFLDFAERTDLTERIGEAVLTRALEALRDWDAAGLDVPQVGVNFALAQLCSPTLIERIKWETERFGVEPGRIAIEVLETVLIKSDADMVVRNLRGLASAGFHVELDDFGTGHASISNLRRFMVDRIKIDRSFIDGIEASEEQQTLTASMIAMAHALGIGTLAEGVETEAARATLTRLGCGQFQGFLLAQPMPFEASSRWLAEFSASAARAEGSGPGLKGDPNTP
jgi:diguanylate cyclase